MSTVFSTLSLSHNYGTEDFQANHQENHQIYSSIFKDAGNSPYHKDLDFGLSDVISKAVNSLKGNYQSKSCSKQAKVQLYNTPQSRNSFLYQLIRDTGHKCHHIVDSIN